MNRHDPHTDVSASLALDLAQNAVRYRAYCALGEAAEAGSPGGDSDGLDDADDAATDDDSGGGPGVVDASQTTGSG